MWHAALRLLAETETELHNLKPPPNPNNAPIDTPNTCLPSTAATRRLPTQRLFLALSAFRRAFSAARRRCSVTWLSAAVDAALCC